MFLAPLHFQYLDSNVINIGFDGWKNSTQLYACLKEVFGLKNPLIDYKLVISNRNIDFSWSKKDFINFIEKHKCSINNPIRISNIKKGIIF